MKETQTLRTGGGQGRWDRSGPYGNIYPDRYVKPSLLEALSEWEAIASEARVSKAALAYRWVMYSSKLSVENGDGVIVRIVRAHIFSSETCLQSRHFQSVFRIQVLLLNCMLTSKYVCR